MAAAEEKVAERYGTHLHMCRPVYMWIRYNMSYGCSVHREETDRYFAYNLKLIDRVFNSYNRLGYVYCAYVQSVPIVRRCSP